MNNKDFDDLGAGEFESIPVRCKQGSVITTFSLPTDSPQVEELLDRLNKVGLPCDQVCKNNCLAKKSEADRVALEEKYHRRLSFGRERK